MRLAIADPPYLGRAAVWYGDKMSFGQIGKNNGGTANITGPKPADNHPDASDWDNPDRHEELVHQLIDNYDGWVIAMAHDNLRDYIPMIPARVPIKIIIWHKPQNMPGGGRVWNCYEPAIVRIPEGRRSSGGVGLQTKDIATISRINNGFPGAKPAAWTRWVLEVMGYVPDEDEVDDLFSGSGAVSAELAQGVLV